MSSVAFADNTATLGSDSSGTQLHLFPTTIESATKMYGYQPIVPAPTTAQTVPTYAAELPVAGGKMTRKYTPRQHGTIPVTATDVAPYNLDMSQSVQRRNARERNRVKQVNNSFARLRQHIPQAIISDLTKGGGRGPDKKISKVDTLRVAVEYIRRLQDMVAELTNRCQNNNSPTTVVPAVAGNAASGNTTPTQATTLYYNNGNASSNNNNNASLSLPTALLQQQQQLTRQQYPNQPLTPISLNVAANYSPPLIQTQLYEQHSNGSAGSCHSPTSSFNSSMSFDSGTYEAGPQQLSPLAQLPVGLEQHNQDANDMIDQQQIQQQQQQQQQQYQPQQQQQQYQPQQQQHHLDAHLQLKFEPYENFNLDDEDCTPDDEEILDYISLWQEQ